jgi:hypothetical protein
MNAGVIRDELHPEELLGKASRGALGAAEATDLHAHLARCPACALQLGLRGEVERALAPTALDYEIGARAVERLCASPDWGAARIPKRAPGPARAPRLATRAAMALALVLVSSVTASALVLGTRGRLWDVAEPEKAPSTGAPAGHARQKSGARAPGAAIEPETPGETMAAPSTPAPSAPTLAAPQPSPAPPAPAALPAPPVAAPPADRVPVPIAVAPAAPARAAASPPATPTRTAPRRATLAIAAEASRADGASDLFGAADRAHREGDFAEARRLYAELAARFSGTREERTARVLRGQMLLDDLGQAAAALRSFDLYLRDEPSGALAEEALVGRAQALRLLGRAAAEAAAWTDLLARFPRSVHAELARERLAAFETP